MIRLILILVFFVLPVGANAEGGDDDWIREAYHNSIHQQRIGNFSRAIQALSPVLEAYPQGYTVNLRMGWLTYMSGHYSNSLTHYRTAIQAAPDALEPKLGLMLPQLIQERFTEAEQTAYQILSRDYYSYLANYRLILALRGQGKNELAREVALKMLAILPTDILYLLTLATINEAMGDKERAAALYKDVIILDPFNPTAKAYFARAEGG